jgi:hypothetical protein
MNVQVPKYVHIMVGTKIMFMYVWIAHDDPRCCSLHKFLLTIELSFCVFLSSKVSKFQPKFCLYLDNFCKLVPKPTISFSYENVIKGHIVMLHMQYLGNIAPNVLTCIAYSRQLSFFLLCLNATC